MASTSPWLQLYGSTEALVNAIANGVWSSCQGLVGNATIQTAAATVAEQVPAGDLVDDQRLATLISEAVTLIDNGKPQAIFVTTTAKAWTTDAHEVARVIGQAHAHGVVPLAKAGPRTFPDGSERYVLGVVLEPLGPGRTDSQGDFYSAEEVQAACRHFNANRGALGLQHQQKLGSDRVELLESFCAPGPMVVNGQPVAAGTWLMGLRVLDDELWASCKSGALTGLSIGGVATRTPRN